MPELRSFNMIAFEVRTKNIFNLEIYKMAGGLSNKKNRFTAMKRFKYEERS